MNRFLLFAWHDHEAEGGMSDFIDSKKTLAEINISFQKVIDNPYLNMYHVFDTKTNRFVGCEGTYIPRD